MSDPLTEVINDPNTADGPTFSAFFAYLRDMNAGVAKVIPSDEEERPLGGVFFLRGELDDVTILREAAEAVARERTVQIEPGEGDIPFGLSISLAKQAGFSFVVTPGIEDGDNTCSVVTVGAELTEAVAAAIQAVEDTWEAELDA